MQQTSYITNIKPFILFVRVKIQPNYGEFATIKT